MAQPGSLPSLDYYTLCSHHVREMLQESGDVTLTARELRPPTTAPGVAKRSQAKELGLCRRCVARPPVEGITFCETCRAARAKIDREKKQRRVENGQCIACSKPVVHGTLRCQKCHDKEAKRKRDLRAKSKTQKPTDKITASRTGASSAQRAEEWSGSAVESSRPS